MLNSIKKYLKKVKEEVSREYPIHSSDQPLSSSNKELPGNWTGVDLDGTLAYCDRSSSYGKVGKPVPAMLALVKKMINHGVRVKIFTARVIDQEQLPIIRKWLKDNGLPELEITNIKDYNMTRLYETFE